MKYKKKNWILLIATGLLIMGNACNNAKDNKATPIVKKDSGKKTISHP